MMEKRVKQRLFKIDESLQLLKKWQCHDYEKFLSDPMLMSAVERQLQIAINAANDIVRKHICEERLQLRCPEKENVFHFIRDKNVYSEDLIQRMIPTSNFRNRIIHDYLDYDPRVVFNVQHNNLSDLEEFITETLLYFKFG